MTAPYRAGLRLVRVDGVPVGGDVPGATAEEARLRHRYRARDDGRIYTARTASEIVDQLRWLSFARGRNRVDFMRGMASRFEKWGGQHLSTESPARFVASLVRVGFLQPIEAKPDGPKPRRRRGVEPA